MFISKFVFASLVPLASLFVLSACSRIISSSIPSSSDDVQMPSSRGTPNQMTCFFFVNKHSTGVSREKEKAGIIEAKRNDVCRMIFLFVKGEKMSRESEVESRTCVATSALINDNEAEFWTVNLDDLVDSSLCGE